ELLTPRMERSAAEALAAKLAGGHWTHDYAPIASEARELGLPVKVGMPPEVMRLMSLYPQPIQRSGVEYLPSICRVSGVSDDVRSSPDTWNPFFVPPAASASRSNPGRSFAIRCDMHRLFHLADQAEINQYGLKIIIATSSQRQTKG